MSFSFGKRSYERMEGIDQRMIEIAEGALQITKIDFGIPGDGGLRTQQRQYELFLEGKSKADGTRKKSNHQSGRALDVFAYVNGKASWDEYALTHIATAFFRAASVLGYEIRWGGHWKSFVDMPHFELVD